MGRPARTTSSPGDWVHLLEVPGCIGAATSGRTVGVALVRDRGVAGGWWLVAVAGGWWLVAGGSGRVEKLARPMWSWAVRAGGSGYWVDVWS